MYTVTFRGELQKKSIKIIIKFFSTTHRMCKQNDSIKIINNHLGWQHKVSERFSHLAVMVIFLEASSSNSTTAGALRETPPSIPVYTMIGYD